jgi:transcriptional regulator with PAS, ATPase and Fis domain
MLEMIKSKIWNILKEKEVSLAMIYDREGHILWHRGRKIQGKDVSKGEGFCKSYIKESLKSPEVIDVEDFINSVPGKLSRSAEELLVKSIFIHPIQSKFFLYIDSGSKDMFTERDRISFRVLGELLEQFITRVRDEADTFGITGKSEAIDIIRDRVVKYSLEEEPVLMHGETGVGKNHIAALIHRYSGRKGKFVIVDTPNIQDSLFESKLFGHKKGAFTDAKFDKTGLVQEAKYGTLFFDEIAEVPMPFQAKLLRFLDTRKFYVLGESIEREADVRIIAATNKDLQQAVAQEKFRQDLYYRLNVLEVKIPPLRERKKDIKSLVLENLEFLREKEIGDGFWDILCNYPWPGNARELINFLKRVGIMVDAPLTGEKITAMLNESTRENNPPGETGDRVEAIREKIKNGESFWEAIWRPFIDRDLDRSLVKRVLKDFYTESSKSFKKMQQRLHVDEKDYRKVMSLIYKYKIDPRK